MYRKARLHSYFIHVCLLLCIIKHSAGPVVHSILFHQTYCAALHVRFFRYILLFVFFFLFVISFILFVYLCILSLFEFNESFIVFRKYAVRLISIESLPIHRLDIISFLASRSTLTALFDHKKKKEMERKENGMRINGPHWRKITFYNRKMRP